MIFIKEWDLKDKDNYNLFLIIYQSYMDEVVVFDRKYTIRDIFEKKFKFNFDNSCVTKKIYFDDHFVGFIQYKVRKNDCYINNLYILLKYRNKGYGTYVLNDLDDSLHNDGCSTITLTPTYKAQNFYKNNGFIETLKRDNGNVIYQKII